MITKRKCREEKVAAQNDLVESWARLRVKEASKQLSDAEDRRALLSLEKTYGHVGTQAKWTVMHWTQSGSMDKKMKRMTTSIPHVSDRADTGDLREKDDLNPMKQEHPCGHCKFGTKSSNRSLSSKTTFIKKPQTPKDLNPKPCLKT